ncbi:MAG TPA: fumarylacetoacetate hydrolase family protein [Candidatus Dormibacteraeota bacterium]|nr:fumarylacetoacetate hydrolase family protein [Candidatus Dormibacteraeota bacterium]
MRLATVGIGSPLGLTSRVVAEVKDPQSGAPRLVDVTAAGELWWAGQGSGDPVRWAEATFPPDLTALLRGGRRALEMAGEAVERASRLPSGQVALSGSRVRYRPDEVERLPLLRPPLLRDFYAFEEHVAAGARRRDEPIPEPWYRRPVYYKGNPATLLAPGAVVPWPAYTDALDYELEVACVLLSGGRDLSLEQAAQAIAGYAVFCDFSARDIQADEMKVRLGPAKSKDFASGLGPWLVTADEVGDPGQLQVSAYLNGERVAQARLSEARWSFPQMVSYASGAEPLEAGEVLASGTVGGGSGQERGRFLEPGDRIECELEGAGRLVHVIGPRHGGGGELVPKPPKG